MKQNQTPLRCLKERGAAWLLTAQMALAFARCLLRLSEKDPRRALETATMFELWLTLNAAKLASEISEEHLCEDHGRHARRLYGALHVFVLLAHFVRHLKASFMGAVAKLPWARLVAMTRTDGARAALAFELGYLDSG